MGEPDSELSLLTQKVIGAAIEVHRCLGPGFLEAVYEEALCLELRTRGIPCVSQFEVSVNYKGQRVGTGFIDILVDERLVLELKAVETLLPIHFAQALSYLKATGHHLALLINFNTPLVKSGIKRVAL